MLAFRSLEFHARLLTRSEFMLVKRVKVLFKSFVVLELLLLQIISVRKEWDYYSYFKTELNIIFIILYLVNYPFNRKKHLKDNSFP